MAGLLPWTAFSTSAVYGCGSVVGNANLVKKVRFPTSVLPLSAVGYAAVHFLLQMGVFLAFLALFHRVAFGPQLVLLVPATLVLIVFASAVAILVAALTVRYRDVAHLLEVLLLAWFWLNPVIYGMQLVRAQLVPRGAYWAYFLNPMAGVVTSYQRALYARTDVPTVAGPQQVLAYRGYGGYLLQLGVGLAVSLVTLAIAVSVFKRMRGDFAEEL
jgi:ABC-2 type transport system permease protein